MSPIPPAASTPSDLGARPPTPASARTQAVQLLGFGLLAVALMLPQADPPWPSFWREWLAGIAMWLVLLSQWSRRRDLGLGLGGESLPAALVCGGLIVLALGQKAVGLTRYWMDVWTLALAVAGFLLSFVSCQGLPQDEREAMADRLAAAWLLPALASAGVAWLQWVGVLTLELGASLQWVRPYGWMEQPNLLCTLMLQGMIGAWRLQARGRLQAALALGLAVILGATAALSQARMGMLVMLLLWGVLAWHAVGASRGRVPRASWVGLAVLSLVYLLAAWAVDRVQHQMAGDAFDAVKHLRDGSRLQVWRLFADAVLQKPWTGWGVQGNGAAQYANALTHPILPGAHSSGHNLLLDLAVWFGVLPSLVVGAWLAIVALPPLLGRQRPWPAVILACSAMALLVHGMLELPLHYLFVLWPLGLILGLGVTPRRPAAVARAQAPTAVMGGLAVGGLVIAAVLAHQWPIEAEARPLLDIDMATGNVYLQSHDPPAGLPLFDALEDLNRFGALPLGAPLTPEARALVERVTQRYPRGFYLERAAMLEGLAGDAEGASDRLRHMARMQPHDVCVALERGWRIWRKKSPVLPPWPAGACVKPGDGA